MSNVTFPDDGRRTFITSRDIDRGESVRPFTRPEYAPLNGAQLPLIYERKLPHSTPIVGKVHRPKSSFSNIDPATLGLRNETALAPAAFFLHK